MTYSQFLWSTVRDLFFKISGWHEYDNDQKVHQLRWLRWQTYILSLSLDPKKLKSPLDLFLLPDEDPAFTGGPAMTEEEYEAKLKRFEEEAHVFMKWDLQMQELYANASGT